MSYHNLVCANSLLEQGFKPVTKMTTKGLIAGFGKFNSLFEFFEIPVNIKKISSTKVAVQYWTIDTTEIVYEATQPNGSKNIIHCNMTELRYQIAPFIHLLPMDRIKDIITENKPFKFLDDTTGVFIKICSKLTYNDL